MPFNHTFARTTTQCAPRGAHLKQNSLRCEHVVQLLCCNRAGDGQVQRHTAATQRAHDGVQLHVGATTDKQDAVLHIAFTDSALHSIEGARQV
jgi:hypothetical protein